MARAAAVLKPLSAQVLEHSYQYEVFGSWYTTIRCRGRVFRVVFDGREQAYFMEWKQVGTIEKAGEDPWRTIVKTLVGAAG